MQVVAVRLTTEELDALDAVVALGFDTTGRMLETVVLVFETGDQLIIHAMPIRKKYLDLLP